MCGSNINPTRTIYLLPLVPAQHYIPVLLFTPHCQKLTSTATKKKVTGSYVSITGSISFTYIQSSLCPFLVSFITYLLIIVEK